MLLRARTQAALGPEFGSLKMGKSRKFSDWGKKAGKAEDFFNKDELFNFIGKKSFDNRSDFQYYPFKLFQEVLINE